MRKRLRQLAISVAAVRDFFSHRDVLEVQTPVLMSRRLPEPQINAFITQGEPLYLQASPEYGMKMLLAAGSGDIYQISKAFRKEQQGEIHSNEFTLIEWYRIGIKPEKLEQETLSLINTLLRLFSLPPLRLKRISWTTLFLNKGMDPWQMNVQELHRIAKEKLGFHATSPPTKNELLDLIFSRLLMPALNENDILWMVEDFPALYAPFAKKERAEKGEIAHGFEVFWKGVELANGCEEENDCNRLRQSFPGHKRLWEELKGLPPCGGVALGFDRLFMLLCGEKSLPPFPYRNKSRC